MRATVEVTLEHPSRGACVYTINHVPLAVARKLDVELMKIMGPVLGHAIAGVNVDGDEIQELLVTGGTAMTRLAHAMTLDQLILFEEKLFEHISLLMDPDDAAPTSLHGFRTKPLYETLFAGDGRLHYYQLLAAALEHNFSSFLGPARVWFTKLQAALAKSRASSKSKSQSSSETAGTSGESQPTADSG